MPCIKVGSSYRFDRNDVVNWIENNQGGEYSEGYFEIPTISDNLILQFPSNQPKILSQKIKNNYKITISYLLRHNREYLDKLLTIEELNELEARLVEFNSDVKNEDAVKVFAEAYTSILKKRHQNEYIENCDPKLDRFINNKNELKIIWGDCLKVLKKMKSESIHLMITSPPYYNAREYSQWENLNAYLNDMRLIIRETYRVLDNHRMWVFNVGDVFDNDNLKTKSVWGKRRLPLGAYFIKIFEEEGFEFVDDIIWDKGEVESQRHKNGGVNYPFYQYPLNCYEHILIFHKHRLDISRIPCPVCGSLNVNGNTQSEIGVQSWECKNGKCFERSPHNRGKRFSLRSNMMQDISKRISENSIDEFILSKWRRDILKFPPVIKIDQNGNNRIGHSAPFPKDIPEMAIKYFSYAGEKILDPFAGSFTTAIVAKKLGRKGIGIEINKTMFEPVIEKRVFEEFNGQERLEKFSL
ncbi:MAG: site-specific DNA-methyltransferase [Deltaproteobacteria bacterium]|nr:site-specific DNA-methyltransferase [Deltaproteobacteria bacterium]